MKLLKLHAQLASHTLHKDYDEREIEASPAPSIIHARVVRII